VAWLDGALTQKYAERAKTARADAEKDFGVARFGVVLLHHLSGLLLAAGPEVFRHG
jgi:hypothetical protein